MNTKMFLGLNDNRAVIKLIILKHILYYFKYILYTFYIHFIYMLYKFECI